MDQSVIVIVFDLRQVVVDEAHLLRRAVRHAKAFPDIPTLKAVCQADPASVLTSLCCQEKVAIQAVPQTGNPRTSPDIVEDAKHIGRFRIKCGKMRRDAARGLSDIA